MYSNILFENLKGYTVEHCKRTHNLSVRLARHLKLSKQEIKQIGTAALYHDIGKADVPKSVREKNGPLTESEMEEMKQHTAYGFLSSQPIFHKDIREMIKYHHENEDGSGYYKLSKDEIPLGAKIIHICDVYDALTSKRPYHKGMKKKDALKFIGEQRGYMFNEQIVDIFLEMMTKKT